VFLLDAHHDFVPVDHVLGLHETHDVLDLAARARDATHLLFNQFGAVEVVAFEAEAQFVLLGHLQYSHLDFQILFGRLQTYPCHAVLAFKSGQISVQNDVFPAELILFVSIVISFRQIISLQIERLADVQTAYSQFNAGVELPDRESLLHILQLDRADLDAVHSELGFAVLDQDFDSAAFLEHVVGQLIHVVLVDEAFAVETAAVRLDCLHGGVQVAILQQPHHQSAFVLGVGAVDLQLQCGVALVQGGTLGQGVPLVQAVLLQDVVLQAQVPQETQLDVGIKTELASLFVIGALSVFVVQVYE